MLIWLFVATAAAGDFYSARDLEALTAIREADLGVERVYVGRGEYYYSLPSSMKIQKEVREGAQTWRYDGQAIFVEEGRNTASSWTPEDVVSSDDDPALYFGVGATRRIDAYGSQWILVEVDSELVDEMKAAYDEEVLREFPMGEPEPTEFESDEPTLAYNAEFLQPTTWTKTTCTEGVVIWDHDNDALAEMGAPLNTRTRKIIWFTHSCTGTMVDSRWALTAAHCVTDDDGNVKSGLVVCSMENLDENITGSYVPGCFTLDEITIGPAWTGAVSNTADFAVVKLSATPNIGWMFVASGADSVIDDFPDYSRGYQRVLNSCSTNSVTSDALTTVDSQNGRQMFGALGEIQSTPSGYVKFDTSTGLGMSGGPHFYCPNGTGCDDGAYITAVQSTITVNTCGPSSCLGGFSAGPKGSTIRDWVTTNTP